MRRRSGPARSGVRWLVPLLVVLVIAVALVAWRPWSPDGPTGDEANDLCAFCGSAIAQTAFETRVETIDREVLRFDDPGCAFTYIDRLRPGAVGLRFHHVDEERWLDGWSVGFVRRPDSPRGFGFGAVDADAEGAIPLETVSAEIAGRPPATLPDP